MYSRKWIKMKSMEREAYLPGSGNTEGSSNNGSGLGGSAYVLPFCLFFLALFFFAPVLCLLGFFPLFSCSLSFVAFSSVAFSGFYKARGRPLFLWEETGERWSATLVSFSFPLLRTKKMVIKAWCAAGCVCRSPGSVFSFPVLFVCPSPGLSLYLLPI